MVRYADDFVILCALGRRVGRATAKVVASQRTQAQRTEDSKGAQPGEFPVPGFQRSLATLAPQWALVCPYRAEPQQPTTPAGHVRGLLNYWTLYRRIPEAVSGLNRLLRGWSGYFHYGKAHGCSARRRLGHGNGCAARVPENEGLAAKKRRERNEEKP
jgi:hypothetical protein